MTEHISAKGISRGHNSSLNFENALNRSKKITALTALLFAIVLIAVTGCFGGSDEQASKTTITRTTRPARDSVRTTVSSHETALAVEHVAPTSDHAVAANDEQIAASEAGHDSVSAVPVSHVVSTTSDTTGDAAVSHDPAAAPEHDAVADAAHATAHWEYTGAVGQNYWGDYLKRISTHVLMVQPSHRSTYVTL